VRLDKKDNIVGYPKGLSIDGIVPDYQQQLRAKVAEPFPNPSPMQTKKLEEQIQHKLTKNEKEQPIGIQIARELEPPDYSIRSAVRRKIRQSIETSICDRDGQWTQGLPTVYGRARLPTRPGGIDHNKLFGTCVVVGYGLFTGSAHEIPRKDGERLFD
jgi:hypothetical protein